MVRACFVVYQSYSAAKMLSSWELKYYIEVLALWLLFAVNPGPRETKCYVSWSFSRLNFNLDLPIKAQ